MAQNKSLTFFRLGTFIYGTTALRHLIGHNLAARKTPQHPEEIKLAELAASDPFDFGELTRRFMELYSRFSLRISLLCALVAVLLCQLSSIAKNHPGVLRQTSGNALIFNLGLSMLSIFFLIGPPTFLFAAARVVFLPRWFSSSSLSKSR